MPLNRQLIFYMLQTVNMSFIDLHNLSIYSIFEIYDLRLTLQINLTQMITSSLAHFIDKQEFLIMRALHFLSVDAEKT